MCNFRWISSDVSREEAMQCLADDVFAIGSFIIHPHQTEPSQLELSVKVEGVAKVIHYNITREENTLRIDIRDESFHTLTELVQGCAENDSPSILTFSVKKNKSVLPWNCEVTVGGWLDAGSFGQVFFGTLSDNRSVALKSLINVEKKVDLISEAQISRDCDHPNVLQSLGICESRQHHKLLHLIVTEYLPGGNLKNYLQSHFFLTPSECISIAQKIASGMAYLASMGIVHRDLAARNVFVGETSSVIKIADFGLSRKLRDGYYKTYTNVFPLAWTAPEGFVISKPENPLAKPLKGTLTHQSDMWSYGIVLWEIYSDGVDPYSGIVKGYYEDRFNLYSYLMNGLRPERPVKCPRVIYAKLRECWNIERKKRPPFSEMHLFLTGLSIEETLFPLVPDVRVTLVSSDKQNFNVSSGILTQSATICADSHTISEKIHIPYVKGPILSLVIDWLSKHKEMEEPNHDVDSAYDQVFIQAINQPTLLKLLSAAKHLGIDALQKLICDSIADRLRFAGQICLKAFNGKYLRANGAVNGKWLVDLAGHCMSCEQWFVEERNDKVVLRNKYHSTWFLRAAQNGSVIMTSNPATMDEWAPVLNANGMWSLQSADGRWLSAHREDDTMCTMPDNKKCEQFWLEMWS